MRKIYVFLTLMMMLAAGSVNVKADDWSIDFRGLVSKDNNVVISSVETVNIGGTDLGTCIFDGNNIDSKFVLQVGTNWLMRPAGLYQFNSGGRAFGLKDCTAGQIITITASGDPNVSTNATLKNSGNSTWVYTVTADGGVKFTPARYLYFYTIEVKDPTADMASYTVKFVDQVGNQLKDDVTYNEAPGTAITLSDSDKAPFEKDGSTYIYTSDDAEGKTVAADGSTVITIVFRAAKDFNYTVNAVDGEGNVLEVIETGTVKETQSKDVYYPQYVLSGTTLYNVATASTPGWYGVTITPDAAEYTYNVVYNNGTIENVAFYTEGEKVEDASVGNNTARASNGKMGHTGSVDKYLEATTLEPGKYQIYMRGVNGNSAERNFKFKVGEDVVFEDKFPKEVNTLKNSEEFSVGESAALSFASEGSSASGIDWFYVVRTGELGEANYTVRFLLDDGTTVLKENETRSGYAGVAATITDDDKAPLVVDDVTYFYVSDDSEENLIVDDGTTVVTITYRAAKDFNYTVNAVDGEGNVLEVIETGTVKETQSKDVYYPQYVLSGTTLYNVKAASPSYYGVTITPDAEEYTYNVVYNNGTIENVAFYTEGEKVKGASVGNNAARASCGQMGHTGGKYLEATTLEPGKYQIYMRGVNGNKDPRAVNFKVGDNVVFTKAIPNGTNFLANSEEFIVAATSALSFSSEGSSASGVDWFYVVRTGDIEPIDVTIGEYGYATLYYSNVNLKVPSGVTAYTATVDGRKISLTDVGAVIPAGTGVVLEGAQGSYQFEITAEEATAGENALQGSDVEKVFEEAGYKYYMLSVRGADAATLGFYYQVEGGASITNGAHKAFIALPATNSANGFLLFETNKIDAAHYGAATEGETYTLSGVRVSGQTLQKGVYITNGKKVVIK